MSISANVPGTPISRSLRPTFALLASLGMACANTVYGETAGSAAAASAASQAEAPDAKSSAPKVAPVSKQPAVEVPTAPVAPVADPAYRVLCEYVVTSAYLDSLDRPAAAAAVAPAPGAAAPNAEHKYPDPTACPLQLPKSARVLDGPGNLVVVVNADGYAAALKASSATRPLRLFLNGFDLGSDGLIAGAERRGNRVSLQFHVPNAKFSQPFWTTVYNQQGILTQAPLQASVGWSVDPAFTPDDQTEGDPIYVSVTNWYWLLAASALAAVMGWYFFWALWGTDTFRVAPTNPWWNDARALQTKLHRATVPFYLWPFQRRSKVKVDVKDARALAILKLYYSGFDPLQLATYSTVAEGAIGGAAPASDQTPQLVVGLALMSDWRTFRLPFSLSRVQWGAWMMFATTVAVYLWLVYARFPVLDGSVLGLVSLSTLTAGASLIIENGSDKPNSAYSKGFFYDIMTDNDGVQQAHRYQAIVVNTLLFAVGLLYVWQHLAYPSFDTSWLELLGLSGLAQTAGKGTLEQK